MKPNSSWTLGWIVVTFVTILVGFALKSAWWSEVPIAVPFEKEPIWATSVYKDSCEGRFAASASYCLGLLFLCYGLYVLFTLAFKSMPETARKVHLVIWTIGPPLFFCIEWFWLYPKFGQHQEGLYEAFKGGQDTAKYFWAAFLGLFAVFEIGEKIKGQPAMVTAPPSSTPPPSAPAASIQSTPTPANSFLTNVVNLPIGDIYKELMAEMRWRRDTEFKLLTVNTAVIAGTGAIVARAAEQPNKTVLLLTLAGSFILVTISAAASFVKIVRDNRIYGILGEQVVALWNQSKLFDDKIPFWDTEASRWEPKAFLSSGAKNFGHGPGSSITLAVLVVSSAIILLIYGLSFINVLCKSVGS